MEGQPLNVLLVEDNPDHAEMVHRSLRDYQVANMIKHVQDGEEALDYLFNRGEYAPPADTPDPDIVLLDLRLPKVSGQEVLAEIRASEKFKNLPVVILTTSGSESDILAAYKNQVNSYLVKPVNFEKFTSLMKDLGFYWLGWNKFPKKEHKGETCNL